MTYDASEITVSVTPSQNADGTITASPTYSKDGAPAGGLSWVNTYSVSTQVTIAGTKVLENKDLASSGLIFGFTLDGTNGDTTHLETSTVAGDATGAFSFDPIVYDMSDMDGATDNQDGTRTKTFTYEVSEVGAGTMDPATGITYTSVKYTVTVTLTDDGQGNLTADVVYNDGTANVAAMQFVNSYEPSSTQLDSSTSLAVSKTFSGRATTGEETFAFEISGTGVAADGVTAITAPLPADDQGQQITRVEITMPKSDTDPTVSPVMAFDTITFDQAGTYTYTIREVVPQNEGDRLENVGYSTEYYTVTVPVRDNGSGQLVVDGLTYAYHASDEDVTGTEFVYDANGGMSFTNVFTPSPVGVQIWGTKMLENAALAQGDFSFRLTSVTVDGVVYDADNADQLPADVPMPTFPESSEGTARPVTIGHTVPNDADGSIFFGELTFNEASLNHVYVYSYEEVIPDEATFDDDLGAWVLDGVRYDTVGEQTVSFAPTKNLDGTINASPVYSTGAAGLSWTNTYDTKPGELVGQTSLRVTKALDGRPWNTADEFTFEITDQGNNAGLASNPMPSETTLKLTQASVTEQEDGSQLAGGSFGNISYEVPGTYTYHISEQGTGGNGITDSKAVYEVTVTVEDNGAGALTVSSVTQQLKGDLGEDVSTEGVKDGVSAFTNVYATNEAQIVISGTKFLQNKDLASSGLAFGFELRGTGEDATSLTASTTPGDGAGAFAFPAITYDEADMVGATVGEDGITRTKVFAYTVSEVGGGQVDANGITHDGTVYNVYVTLTDDGMGNLTADVSYDEGVEGIAFTNVYAEKATAEVTFDVTKTLTGRDMAADTFSFLVKDDAGQTVATASNAAAAAGQPAVSQFTLKYGIATIDKADPATVVIDPATGARSVTLHYTVCELHGDSAAPINGVTYDPAVYDISVIVTDNGDGTMSAVPIYPEGVTSLSFENSYAALGSFTPSGMKSTYVPDGANPAASGFSFAVVDENGQTVTMGSTTGLDGAIDFGEITITSPGEHIYWISEINSGAAGIDYDESIYKLVVNMEDLGNGQLQETSHAYYDAAGNPLGTDYVSFNNTYGGEGTSISLSARKVLEGAALEAGQFSFEVVDENGTVVAGGTNNASGVFSFSIPYTYTVQQADQPDQSDVADQSQAADSVAGDAASVDAVASDGSIESDVTQGDGANSPDVTDPSQASGVEGEGQSDDSSVIGVPDGEGNTDSSVEAPSEDAGVDLGTDQPPAGGTADEVIGGDQTGTSGQPVEGQAIEDGEPDQTSEAVEANALSLGDLLAPTQAIADDQDAEQFMAPEASAAVVADAATDPVVSETPANEGGEGSSDDMTGGTQVVSSSLGTHYYTIREVIPAGATQNADGTYTLDGVTYDQSSYRFSVTVVDNGDGTMSAHLNTGEKDIIHFFADGTSLPVTPAGDDGMYNVVFTNVYEPTNPAKVNLEGTKMLTGRDMAAGEFSFEVRDTATGELVTTGSSTASADGTASSISFVEFTYDSAGEYDLAVSEVQGDPDVTDITYDSRTFGVHVSVTDDGAGNLVANVTYDEPVAFSNSYTQTFESTSVNIQAVKTLTGRAMEDGEFYVLGD